MRGLAPNGLTIRNETNGTCCKVLSLPSPPYSLVIDSDSCLVQCKDGTTLVKAFELHDEGYVALTPYGEVYQDIAVSWFSGSNIVHIDSEDITYSDEWINKYIFIGGEWHKIVDTLNGGGLVLMTRFADSGSQSTMITTMNEITIEGDGLALEDISIDYIPRVL